MRILRKLWTTGVVGTFLSGLLAILPIVFTVAIVGWVARTVYGLVGPGTTIGAALHAVGMRFVQNEIVATVIGWALALLGIWFVGLLVQTRARSMLERAVHGIVDRIPFVKSVYGTSHQVISMLSRRDQNELSSMAVVFCDFGQEHGAGFLALLATHQKFQFLEREYLVVYVPTSPLPMSGGIVFTPADRVRQVDMSAEQLMQIYLSLGVLTPQAVPARYHAATAT